MPYTDLEYKFKRIGKNVRIGRNVYFCYSSEQTPCDAAGGIRRNLGNNSLKSAVLNVSMLQ